MADPPPDDPLARQWQSAVLEFRRGRFLEAASICRHILAASPAHLGALRVLGLSCLQLGDPGHAQQHLRRVLELSPMSVEAHNEFAASLGAAGKLDRAIEVLRAALRLDPASADAAFNLGTSLLQMKKFPEAAEAFAAVLRARPDDAQAHAIFADALRESGRFGDSVTAYRRAIELGAADAPTHLRLGLALKGAGRNEEALEAFNHAAALAPAMAEAHFNAANALKSMGRLTDAAKAFSSALAAKPGYVEALHNLATVYEEQRDWHSAGSAFGRVLELRPDFQPALRGLGNALRELKDYAPAAQVLRRALATEPDSHDVLVLLADVLLQLKREPEALGLYRRALELQPHDPARLVNAGILLDRAGNPEAAIKLFRGALSIDPNLVQAKFSLALSLLRTGQFPEGWTAYESRFEDGKSGLKELPQPTWTGQDIRGQTLLLRAEQGFGDAIQFIRYVPMLVERGARLIVQCRRPLHRLFAQDPGIAQLVANDDPLPPFDFHLPLMSLPRVMGTTLDNVPASVPYLRPPADAVESWRSRIQPDSGRLKVGIVWAGSTGNEDDVTRSMRFEQLAPLLSLTSASFYSLQIGPARDQLKDAARTSRVTDLAGLLHDFAETAAAILQLDLVLSVDTSVAHLSAALAKPTWVMLPFASEWRWLMTRSDSPWYPTMRLFRQPTPGDWKTLIEELSAELRTNPPPLISR